MARARATPAASRSSRPTRRSPTRRCCWRAMQYAATFGFAVWLRPQDPHLAHGGVAHDGEVATRLGLPAIPAFAETDRARAPSWSSRASPARACTCAGSRPREAVDLVRAAKARRAAGHLRRGRAPPAPVRARHRLLRLALPPRAAASRARATATRCARGLADGTIDAVCSDHTPVDDDAKQLPFGEVRARRDRARAPAAAHPEVGREMRLPLAQALARAPREPARILGDRRRASRRRRAGRHLRLRPGDVLHRRAVGAAQPGQEHAVPRLRAAGRRALDAGRRARSGSSAAEPASAGPRRARGGSHSPVTTTSLSRERSPFATRDASLRHAQALRDEGDQRVVRAPVDRGRGDAELEPFAVKRRPPPSASRPAGRAARAPSPPAVRRAQPRPLAAPAGVSHS